MKISKAILSMCLGVLFLLGSSAAQAVVLTFEGLQALEPIDNYYNGGLGGFGSGPGPNYGITFTSDSLALTRPPGNFSNNPSGNTIMFFLNGADTMNVAAGFTTGFSFFYASSTNAGFIDVFSGLNGTGSLLASFALPATPNPFNVWVPIGVTFNGTAQSVVFGGSANRIGFDDVTLGSAVPGVPDSGSTVVLLGASMIVVGLLHRRLAAKRA